MASILTPPKPAVPGGGPPRRPAPGGGWRDDRPNPVQRYKTGTWLLMGAITMVFAGFVSAYIVRRGVSTDWRPIEKPAVLWGNTAVLLASSLTLELARRRQSNPWMGITSLLGAVFLIGQYMAWQQLRASGIYLATNPSSSFFYLLTGAHGLHLLGGAMALFYVAVRAAMQAGWGGREGAVAATALYWHFMDVLWLFVFLFVFLWR